MSRTITALFDTKADAEAGAERLREAGLDAAHIGIHDDTTHKLAGDYSTHEDKGLWASIKNVFVPHEDRHAYEEGIRRGGFLLTADVDDDDTATAVDVLENANSIDLDARTADWRASGWDYAGVADPESDTVYGVRDTNVAGSRYRTYLPSDGR